MSKVVREDRLACHRTLVGLILSALANRGEPSSFEHGNRLETLSNKTLLSPYRTSLYKSNSASSRDRVYTDSDSILAGYGLTSTLIIHTFKVPLYLLLIQGLDVVLGMAWL
ncbi:hypothetical protein CR513_01787, partial [Mucuna pruriens]